jgi:hypothetical protein
MFCFVLHAHTAWMPYDGDHDSPYIYICTIGPILERFIIHDCMNDIKI